MERVRQVEAKTKKPSEVGCRGPPMFISETMGEGLFYLDSESFFLIPIAHCLLYGLVSSLTLTSARRH